MDIRLPVLDGFTANRELTRLGSRSRVLILTTYDANRFVRGAAGRCRRFPAEDDTTGSTRGRHPDSRCRCVAACGRTHGFGRKTAAISRCLRVDVRGM